MGKNGCFGTGKKAQGRGISCSYRHGAPGFLPLCLLWRPSIISRAARGPAKRTIVENRIMYRFLADLVLAVHFAYVAFVVAALALGAQFLVPRNPFRDDCGRRARIDVWHLVSSDDVGGPAARDVGRNECARLLHCSMDGQGPFRQSVAVGVGIVL